MTDMDPETFRAYVANHVSDYFSTDGESGATFNGLPCVVLTTRGARSGELRHSPVIRVAVPDSEDYVVVASMGGAPKHPSWYFNIVADPRNVTLQDKGARRSYEARATEGTERDELWALAAAVYDLYDDYQDRTSRTIPVFRLSPTDSEPHPQDS